MLRIGIFGGTFNPPHNGHLYIAEQAMSLARLDKMVFVPCGNPYHKTNKNSTEAKHRYEMVRLAIQGKPNFEISDIETKFDEPSYTAKTLRRFKSIYPKDKLCFLVGGDSLMDMEGWYHPEEIFKLAEIIAAKRGGVDSQKTVDAAEMLKKKYNAEITLIDIEPMELSASHIRETLFTNADTQKALPEKVFEYIKKTKLYKDSI